MPAPQFLLLAAMAEEREPFLEAADAVTGERPGPTAGSLLTELVLDGIPGQILTTGIGPVNAAAALTGMLTAAPAPARILSVGSAGGLHENIGVGEVIIGAEDRKSTRLNSSHVAISYAVFCLKKKTNQTSRRRQHT